MTSNCERPDQDGFDYIIVGSGAGGAPLAARLAQKGKGVRVLVIEAGANHTSRGPLDSGNEISRVPLLHAASTEHEDLSWRFFVDHYKREADGRLPDGIPEDPKWHTPDPSKKENSTHEGIFYPRAAGIGGCTVHNAMITIAGPDSDWDDLADFLGDDSWRSKRMRAYFQRLEHNDYLDTPNTTTRSALGWGLDYVRNGFRWLVGLRPDLTGGQHGFGGWLHTSVTDLSIGLYDKQLVKMLKAALWQSKLSGMDRAWSFVSSFLTGRIRQALDPNHAETQANSPEGVTLIPLAVYGQGTTIHQNSATPYAMRGRRSSPRELLLETLASYPENLVIWTDCLVTKVLLEDVDEGIANIRAVGVELRRGANLYRAHVNPSDSEGELQTVRVRRGGEVILAGGTFNTPQLLMLSGIGDREQLKNVPDPNNSEQKGIPSRVHLPGVGKNLHDRYEVSVVSQMKSDFSLLDDATFQLPAEGQEPDRHLRRWREEGTGLYTSNGAVLGIFKRSRPELPKPDLFLFGIPSQFKGYEVGYSKPQPQHNLFTWVILKSHSHNHDGRVRLRTVDPRDTPLINFNSFRTVSDPQDSKHDADVLALLDGVKFVRGILSHAQSVVGDEVHPGTSLVPQKNDEAAKEWIRRDAWGHHACGTCRMGPEGDPDAVLDSRFRVRAPDGRRVAGLRVVDASIFPKIPGYFIVTNIYMASEKAADVILEDTQGLSDGDCATYPAELRKLEAKAIEDRRKAVGPTTIALAMTPENHNDEREPNATTQGLSAPDQVPISKDGQWRDDVTGLALSGGGIRSATLGLGVLQSLARYRLLRRFDFLSTVSGGGYIGSFLGRFYDRLRPTLNANATTSGPQSSGKGPADRVEEELISPDSKVVDWLRKHGNYIAPQGRGDGRLNAAVFIRNLLSVHLVVGLVIFSVFGLANLIRYGLFDTLLVGVGLTISRGEFPIGHLLESWFGPFFSPWFIVVDLLLLFYVVPLITGYWIVSQDKHESFKLVPTTLLFVVAGVLLWIGVSNGLHAEPVFMALSLLSSLVWVELAWRRGRDQEEAIGTGGVETQRLRTRNYLTYDLGMALGLTGGAAVFVVMDTLGHGLHEWINTGNLTYAQAFSALGAMIATAFPAAKLLAGFLSERRPGPPSTIVRLLKRDMIVGGLAIVLFTLPLLFYSFTAHAAYRGGTAVAIGMGITLATSLMSLAFALPGAQTFINRSSLAQTYGARLARAYLGASNPLRHRPEGMNVTEVIPGDDVASIREYRPHEASGPFHLINLTINQTLDKGSLLRKRDRQGNIMAVSCLGMSIGEKSHSAWENGTSSLVGQKVPSELRPLGRSPGEDHPLVDVWDRQADRAEMLSLRQWVGLSGAAIGSGLGRYTNQGMALLMGLTNLRTGHWWDSGIPEAHRVGFPELTFLRRCLYLIPRVFPTQSLLIYEWIARFPGTWERFWHLSDGGYFENLGVYELIRRRVPRIIVCDGGADPSYQLGDLGELVRKARIDFAARIEAFSVADLAATVPAALLGKIGTADELTAPRDAAGNVTGPSPKHAALFWVHYPNQARRSVLLYLKATVTGDESPDIRHYHETHPEFPHEATADQFFDEAQWESYRKLGEHLSDSLFAPDPATHAVDWFWQIPLPSSQAGAP